MNVNSAFTVNGSVPTDAVAVAAGSTVTLAISNTSGINGIVWSVVGNDNRVRVNPAITAAGSPPGATASFVMPADAGDGLGQSYRINCTVSDGGSPANTSSTTVVVGVANGSGIVPFAAGEDFDRHPTYGWTESLNRVLGSAAQLPKRLAAVGSRCYAPVAILASTAGWNVRVPFYAEDDIDFLRIGIPNWCVSSTEIGSGGLLTIAGCSVTYNGVTTRLTFNNGSNSYAIPDKSTGRTDICAIPRIPRGFLGTLAWHMTGAVGIPYMGAGLGGTWYPAGGDALETSATDKSQSPATITDGAFATGLYPVEIHGYTRLPVIGEVGDSRLAGAGELVPDATRDLGQFGRPIGRRAAYVNMARAGETAANFLASHALRMQCLQGSTVIFCNYGINDLGAVTPAALLVLLQQIRALFPGIPFYISTLSTETTSTDNWKTTGNQTLTARATAALTHNVTNVRTNAGGFDGWIEIADYVNDRNGKWFCDGVTNNLFTPDGTHESSYANRQIAIPNLFI